MSNFTTIEDVCDLVTDGTHYTPKNVGLGIPFLTVKDVTDVELDFTNCSFISDADYQIAKLGNSAPQKGDVLFSKDGTVGKVHIVNTDKPFAVLSSLAILRPNKKLIESQYLGNVLRLPLVLDDALKRKTGSAIRRIILADLKRVRFPLPSLEEQRRIAEILDRAEELRSKRREAIAQLETLTQAIFLEIFGDPATNPKGWEVRNMDECAKRIQIGPFGTQLHEEDYIDNGIPLINPTHIQDGKIFPNTSFSISNEKHQQLSQYHLEVDDVILGRRGEMGRCAIVSKNEHGWLCGTGSLFIRPKNTLINSVYLFSILSNQSIKKYLEKASQGVTMANLNKTIVSQIPVVLPPLSLQQKFAHHVESVEKLKAAHCASLSELDALFSSLQHRAFRGEL